METSVTTGELKSSKHEPSKESAGLETFSMLLMCDTSLKSTCLELVSTPVYCNLSASPLGTARIVRVVCVVRVCACGTGMIMEVSVSILKTV